MTKRVYEIDLRRTDADGYVEKTLVARRAAHRQPRRHRRGRRLRHRRRVLPARAVVRDRRAAAGRPPAHRQRQQLPGQRRAHPGHARRHRDGHHRPATRRAIEPSRRRPLVGHRGASGYRPEHTLAVVRDGDRAVRRLHRARRRLDEGRRARRPARERDQRHDGCRRPRRVRGPPARPRSSTACSVTGWFTEDFTLAELRTLRAEGAAAARPAGEHRVRRALPGPDARRGPRPGPPLVHLRRRARSASTPRRSTRRTSTRSACRSRSRCVAALQAQRRRPRRRARDHPELRGRQPARARRHDRRRRSPSWSSCSGAPVRLRGRRRPAHVRRPRDARRARARSRRTPTASALEKSVMIPRDAGGHPRHADAGHRATRTRAGLDGARLDVPAREPVPARSSSARAATRTPPATSPARSRCSSTPAWTASSPTTPTSP